MQVLSMELFNASIVDGTFPTELKQGEVTSVFKANDQTKKKISDQ